jgi:hypothetical protein
MKKKAAPTAQPPYVLPPPNDDVFAYGGNLGNLRHGKLAAGQLIPASPVFSGDYGPLGADYRWLETFRFEQLCDEAAAVQTAIKKAAAAGYSDAALKRLEDAVVKVFEEVHLPEILAQFYETAPLIAQYFAAKAAYQQTFPEDTDVAVDPGH